MNVTLRQPPAFLITAELESFTRAGERMHLSQSAASVLVNELERNRNVRLLDRTTRRVELTDAGRQFFSRIARLMADLEHAVRHAHGRVSVAAPRQGLAVLPSIARALGRSERLVVRPLVRPTVTRDIELIHRHARTELRKAAEKPALSIREITADQAVTGTPEKTRGSAPHPAKGKPLGPLF